MVTKHEVYPGELARDIEDGAEELDTSVSGLYKEGVRRMAQDPDHPLELPDINKENEN